MTVPTIGSLCSGYGGLDMAAEHVFGAVTVWHADPAPGPSAILAARWPGVPNLGNIADIDWSRLDPIDILTAGYPCQPFALAGRRQGTDDDRHLWPHVCAAIRALRPRIAILENVPGHRSLGFDAVLGDLATIGFDAQWTSIRASDVGAAHRRERLFVLAYPTNTAAPSLADTRSQKLTCGTGLCTHDAKKVRRARSGDSATRVDFPWGEYGAAVRRWGERLGRAAPAPLIDGPKGGQRLSARFDEWHMGLPEGHVTDVAGLTWNQQIEAIGNGVVPQQAAAAIRELLERAA